MMTLCLRPATNADCPAIERLVFGVLAEYGLTPDPEDTDKDLRDIERVYLAVGGTFDVLTDETGNVVGTVALCPISESTWELRKMYLAPGVRGHGHGRKLLEHAIARATALGASRIVLETATVLREAVALYERCGFRRYESKHLACRCNLAYGLDLPRRIAT